MKIYIKDGNVYWLDEVLEDSDAEFDLNQFQEEILRNGGTAEYKDGAIVIIPKAPEVINLVNKGLSKLDFMNKFSDAELSLIYTVAKTNVDVEIWLAKFNATTPDEFGYSIYLDDPATISSIKGLESAGLIAEGRSEEILN